MQKLIERYYSFIAIGAIILLSVLSWESYFRQELTLAYNDSMSHLNLTRLIVDNRNPGLAQMGGVWLPMHRILQLPLIWNDTLWKTGLAGSLISMAGYIASTIFIFSITHTLTRSKIAAAVASLAFALNLNILYIQTTPLTESLYIAVFLLSVFAFTQWTKTHNLWYLLVLSISTLMQILTRYDGWFVAIITAAIIIGYELKARNSRFSEAAAKGIIFIAPCILGIFLWLLWGLLIFNNPLYFASGPYSAKSQQEVIDQTGMLVTKGNFEIASMTYLYTISHTVGLYVAVAGVLGIIYYLVLNLKKRFNDALAVTVLLASPIAFNIIALFLGFSTINIPELAATTAENSRNLYFNTRYGLLALPFFAIGLGLINMRQKLFVLLSISFIVMQTYTTHSEGIITLLDGTVGASAYTDHAAEEFLKANLKQDDTVHASLAYNNPLMFTAMGSLKNVIHEGTVEWQNDPAGCMYTYTIIRTHTEDPLRSLIGKESCATVYQGENVTILKKSQLSIDQLPRQN